MGTTLTGSAVRDTYDSLIKVTDNGPLSGTAKYLSDGLGNDSKLALSTGNIGINTATPDIFGRFYTYSLGLDSSGTTAFQINGTSYSTIDMGTNGVRLGFFTQSGTETSLGNLSTLPLVFQTNSVERMRITSAGNVGIGNSIPSSFLSNGNQLVVGSGAAAQGITIYSDTAGTGNLFFADGTAGDAAYRGFLRYDHVSDSMQIYTGGANLRLSIDSAGNVGIGTDSPNVNLEVSSSDSFVGGLIRVKNNRSALFDGDINGAYQFANDETSGGAGGVRGSIVSLVRDSAGKSDMYFATASSNASPTEKMRILADGGITFNGDTAAANALDDYEEGTWTMGVLFGGASVGVTYSSNTGTYTKIGRKVTVNGFLVLTSKGSSTGVATLTGLPFTIPNNHSNYSAVNYWMLNVSFANQFQGNGSINTTRLSFDEITEAGVTTAMDDTNFANNSGVIVSYTYFV